MFACTSLVGVNKAGTLKKDADGYRDVVVGALNVFNSAGSFYAYDEARELFEESNAFMRRIQRAALRGEVGHPKPPPRELNPQLQRIREEEYARRCMTIDDNNVCVQHRRIWLDFDAVKDKKGNPIISIMSSIIPSGEKFAFLERQLENPHENVCFSIRAFTTNTYERGVEKRVLREIVTFDYVNEPGIATAEKYFSPALENMEQYSFSRARLEDALYNHRPAGISMESVIVPANSLFKNMGWSSPDGKAIMLPASSRW
jgi:hypothetical protein